MKLVYIFLASKCLLTQVGLVYVSNQQLQIVTSQSDNSIFFFQNRSIQVIIHVEGLARAEYIAV